MKIKFAKLVGSISIDVSFLACLTISSRPFKRNVMDDMLTNAISQADFKT